MCVVEKQSFYTLGNSTFVAIRRFTPYPSLPSCERREIPPPYLFTVVIPFTHSLLCAPCCMDTDGAPFVASFIL